FVHADQRNQVLPPVPVHHGVADQRMRFESVFDVLRGHILAARGDDDVLFSVGDSEVAVRVKLADVAGVKPSIWLKHFLGGGGIFEVTLHHARTTNEDLAVRSDFDLRPREWGTNGADLYLVGRIYGGASGSLG